MTAAGDVTALIAKQSNPTGIQLAQWIPRSIGYQQFIMSTFRRRIEEGRSERHGRGNNGDWFAHSLKRTPPNWSPGGHSDVS
jgi:hypothetical protein